MREWEPHRHQTLWDPPGSRPPAQHPDPGGPLDISTILPLMMQEDGLWIRRSEVKPWHPSARGAPRRTFPYQPRSEVPLKHVCCKSSEKSLGHLPTEGLTSPGSWEDTGEVPLPPSPIPLQPPNAKGTAESGEPGRLAWFVSGDTSGADVSEMKCSSWKT